MRRLRVSLGAYANRLVPSSVSAGRLKRMKSIRKKLRNTTISLTEIQDLGGCRAVLDTVEQCDQLAELFASKTKHEIRKITDYSIKPRDSGYRSKHLIVRFHGDDTSHDGKLIEFQVRTKLQHAWATTIEAVGLVLGEDLKGGLGSQEWLRLFALMSGEIAELENCSGPKGIPTGLERRRELIDLDKKLSAVNALDSYRRIIQATSNISLGPGGMYLLEYNPQDRSVMVKSMTSMESRLYGERERTFGNRDTVLVDVEKASDLRAAYPNYYLDVDMFLQIFRDVLHPIETRVMAQGDRPAVNPSAWRPDFSEWFKRQR